MMEQITSKSWFGLNAAIKRKLFLLLLFLVFSLGAAEMQKLLSAVSSGAEKLFAGHRVYGCFLKDTPRCFRKSTAPKSSKLRMNYIYITTLTI